MFYVTDLLDVMIGLFVLEFVHEEIAFCCFVVGAVFGVGWALF